MKTKALFLLIFILLLVLAGCKTETPAPNQTSDAVSPEVSSQSEAVSEPKSQTEVDAAFKVLPASYPIDILPLAADAKILDVKENPASNGLEIIYVSDNGIDTLCDFYEGALSAAPNLNTDETSDGYMIFANMDGIGYNIMLSKDAMRANPQYAGKTSVYLILSGLEAISSDPQMPEGEGEAWPHLDLPGVPQLEGHIGKILREDGIIRLEITVESAEKVKSYIDALTAKGFSFDTQPNIDSDHMEFLAFKDNSMMSFAYKGEENAVSIEYQK
jgi:hypothetical protein